MGQQQTSAPPPEKLQQPKFGQLLARHNLTSFSSLGRVVPALPRNQTDVGIKKHAYARSPVALLHLME
ncbi:hypothetical protein [Microcoleus sp. BR0-C5]|uniref:hypothetical protein n=1 Tax=Microcoleus sp. BR0-C5 TaxID=2818713 RepID=UPI002FD66476